MNIATKCPAACLFLRLCCQDQCVKPTAEIEDRATAFLNPLREATLCSICDWAHRKMMTMMTWRQQYKPDWSSQLPGSRYRLLWPKVYSMITFRTCRVGNYCRGIWETPLQCHTAHRLLFGFYLIKCPKDTWIHNKAFDANPRYWSWQQPHTFQRAHSTCKHSSSCIRSPQLHIWVPHYVHGILG